MVGYFLTNDDQSYIYLDDDNMVVVEVSVSLDLHVASCMDHRILVVYRDHISTFLVDRLACDALRADVLYGTPYVVAYHNSLVMEARMVNDFRMATYNMKKPILNYVFRINMNCHFVYLVLVFFLV